MGRKRGTDPSQSKAPPAKRQKVALKKPKESKSKPKPKPAKALKKKVPSTKVKAAPKAKGTTKAKSPKGKAKISKEQPKVPKVKSTQQKEKSASIAKASSSTGSMDAGPSFLGQYLTDPQWKAHLSDTFNTDYFQGIDAFLKKEYTNKQVFPPKELIFNALNLTPFDEVKVVILGQDPYHDDNQAHGLSFSIPHGIPPPPSLKNIYKELVQDIPGFIAPQHGCLEDWTKQGVLLLNAALTVEAHKANSHAKIGWHQYTDHIIQTLSDQSSNVVFILWGGFAHKKHKLIDSDKHTVIMTAHPSPLSFNKFMGCKCFSQANSALKNRGLQPVDWKLK